MNLLEIPVQEVSADGQDVAAAAVVLLHCHRLRKARARHRRATAGGEKMARGSRERKKKLITNKGNKHDWESEDIKYVMSSEQRVP